jgi:ribonucleoside-diphosphate reductase alpha chain
MAGYKNFQSNNKKYTRVENRSVYDPEHNPTVKAVTDGQMSIFEQNIDKWVEFMSWAKFYPDLFVDLISQGGIKLHTDQRIFLRAAVRYYGLYGVFSRGWGKTFLEVLASIIICILYPGTTFAISAQTKEASAKILGVKAKELLKMIPMLEKEIFKKNFSAKNAEIIFRNGSELNILINGTSSLGQRRHRIAIEESAQMNNNTYRQVIRPIVMMPRPTAGKNKIHYPPEPNHSISFFTTSWFRNTEEFERVNDFIDEMAEKKGKIFLSSDFVLPAYYGRGEPLSEILEEKEKSDYINFSQNYMSKWIGSAEGALVDVGQLANIRSLENFETQSDGESEYYVSVDVARSTGSKNAATSITVTKVKRKENNMIRSIENVLVKGISPRLTFDEQAVEVKKIHNDFGAVVTIADGNGLGKGLVDSLMKESFDEDGMSLGCWDSINTDDEPKVQGAESCLYVFLGQSENETGIRHFMNAVKSGVLRLLKKKKIEFVEDDLPFLETDFMIDEITNLKLKQTNDGRRLTIEQEKGSIQKDRYSSIMMNVFYIMEFENEIVNLSTNTQAYINALSY